MISPRRARFTFARSSLVPLLYAHRLGEFLIRNSPLSVLNRSKHNCSSLSQQTPIPIPRMQNYLQRELPAEDRFPRTRDTLAQTTGDPRETREASRDRLSLSSCSLCFRRRRKKANLASWSEAQERADKLSRCVHRSGIAIHVILPRHVESIVDASEGGAGRRKM